MSVDSYISGIGYYVPSKVLTNFDLERMVDTSDEWIRTRTGIIERRISPDGVPASFLGIESAKKAIQDAGISPEEIDLIITATITPDMIFPATACLIQAGLDAKNAGTFDLSAACSGFVYGLSVADQFIKTGKYKTILVVATETLSKITDWTDRNTCILFGDGAGAAVVKPSNNESSKIIDFLLKGDGSYKDLLCIPAGGSAMPTSIDTINNRLHYMKMRGNEVFKVAVKMMADSVKEIIKRNNVNLEEIKYVIPHQANLRIIEMVAKLLNVSLDKVIINLDKFGNTSAASIPLALAEAYEQGKLTRGDLIVLVAFGGGFTWGAMLLKW